MDIRRKRPLIRKQIIGENLVYAGIWAVVYLIPIMHSTLMSEEYINIDNVFLAWGKITPYFILFMLNNQVFVRFMLSRDKIVGYLLVSLLVLCATFSCIEVYEQWRISVMGGYAGEPILPRHASLTDLRWYWNIFLGIFMFAANVGIKKFYESMQRDEDQERLARENIEAEMYYLQYQINPHFMMNTLNNIHALIDIDADSAKRGLIQLSGMMRYVVYDADATQIPLSQDIRFVENYIELMKIRYSQQVNLRFNYPKNIDSFVVIPPLVLIVFVENAFKHGVRRNHNSYIDIDIEVGEKQVYIHVENSVYNIDRGKRVGGVGLENVKKRLEYIYGNKHKLNIESLPDKYCVTLEIPVSYEC